MRRQPRYHSIRLRVVWVQTPKEVLRLVTNLSPVELSAGEVALLYKQRWQIELFFRWIKCILGCRHWLAGDTSQAAAGAPATTQPASFRLQPSAPSRKAPPTPNTIGGARALPKIRTPPPCDAPCAGISMDVKTAP